MENEQDIVLTEIDVVEHDNTKKKNKKNKKNISVKEECVVQEQNIVEDTVPSKLVIEEIPIQEVKAVPFKRLIPHVNIPSCRRTNILKKPRFPKVSRKRNTNNLVMSFTMSNTPRY
jgi:hypothetical protein